MKNSLIVIALSLSISLFSQNKEDLKIKDNEIKKLKENQLEILEKNQISKTEIDKLNNEIQLLKNVIKESNIYFLKDMFDETFNETYFKTRDLSKTDDSENFKLSNALVKSIIVEASLDVQKLCKRVTEFNTNYLTLIQIRDNVLNKKFDESKVQEALVKIKALPEIDPESKLGDRKQSIKDLLFNYKGNICILKKYLDEYKNKDQSAIKPLYDKLLEDPRFKNYPYLKQLISDMKKNLTSYTGEDDLLPCLEDSKKSNEENEEKKIIPQDSNNKN